MTCLPDAGAARAQGLVIDAWHHAFSKYPWLGYGLQGDVTLRVPDIVETVGESNGSLLIHMGVARLDTGILG